ncbi:uncharacterized protein DDB_G0284459-like [Cyclopterus lumpus]|uniref:uncharacterized protein DDB_G0284459-like n=1 Tax=Cyclopterus lumpus TaxID=8103 RepID=UPI0014863D28|nr:uncharacterized protein DDB_G0284459-like [Cyclopterus lumpus]
MSMDIGKSQDNDHPERHPEEEDMTRKRKRISDESQLPPPKRQRLIDNTSTVSDFTSKDDLKKQLLGQREKIDALERKIERDSHLRREAFQATTRRVLEENFRKQLAKNEDLNRELQRWKDEKEDLKVTEQSHRKTLRPWESTQIGRTPCHLSLRRMVLQQRLSSISTSSSSAVPQNDSSTSSSSPVPQNDSSTSSSSPVPKNTGQHSDTSTFLSVWRLNILLLAAMVYSWCSSFFPQNPQ